ncbi:hypothetical protein PTKIN_Ptkin10aG0194500 [Pterospermum kingtungense]
MSNHALQILQHFSLPESWVSRAAPCPCDSHCLLLKSLSLSATPTLSCPVPVSVLEIEHCIEEKRSCSVSGSD